MRVVRTTGLLIFLLFMTVAADNIDFVRYPIYEYYGRTLNVDEFLELVEQDVPLHCGMIPSSDIYQGRGVPDYACFHTEEEVDRYMREVTKPMWEQIAREYPAQERPLYPSGESRSTGHWALFAHSGHSGHLGNVGNGTSCAGNSGVWSFYREPDVNDMTLFRYSNCSGVPSFKFDYSVWSCVFAWPISCGGMQGAKVP